MVIPFEPLWAHYKRLLKPRGVVVLTASQPFTSMLVMSNRAWFRYEWIWEKQKGSDPLNARRKPLQSHENILVFSPASTTYNPQMRAGIPYHRKGDCRIKSKNYSTANAIFDRGSFSGDRFPLTVLRFSGEGMNSGNFHSTQKPVALMEYLIRTYSDEGDTVLDNAMGSGTTLVACLNTDRHGIGIESDPAIFATAQRRIVAERSKTSLFVD